jgi:hypothetical protein
MILEWGYNLKQQSKCTDESWRVSRDKRVYIIVVLVVVSFCFVSVGGMSFYPVAPDAERFRFMYAEKMDGNWRQCPRQEIVEPSLLL